MTKRSKHHSSAGRATPPQRQGWVTWFLPFLAAPSTPVSKRSKRKRPTPIVPKDAEVPPVLRQEMPVASTSSYAHAELDPEVEEFLKELHRSLEVKKKGVLAEPVTRRRQAAFASAQRRASELRQKLRDIRERRREAAQQIIQERAEQPKTIEIHEQQAPAVVQAPPSPVPVQQEMVTMPKAPEPVIQVAPKQELPEPVQAVQVPEAAPQPTALFGLFGDASAEVVAEPEPTSGAASPTTAKDAPAVRRLRLPQFWRRKDAVQTVVPPSDTTTAPLHVTTVSPPETPRALPVTPSWFQRLWKREKKEQKASAQTTEEPVLDLATALQEVPAAALQEIPAVSQEVVEPLVQIQPEVQPAVMESVLASPNVPAVTEPERAPEAASPGARASWFQRLFKRQKKVQTEPLPAAGEPVAGQESVAPEETEVLPAQQAESWSDLFQGSETSAISAPVPETAEMAVPEVSQPELAAVTVPETAPQSAWSVASLVRRLQRTESAEIPLQEVPTAPLLEPVASQAEMEPELPSAAPVESAARQDTPVIAQPEPALHATSPVRASWFQRLFKRQKKEQAEPLPAAGEPVAVQESVAPEETEVLPAQQAESWSDLFQGSETSAISAPVPESAEQTAQEASVPKGMAEPVAETRPQPERSVGSLFRRFLRRAPAAPEPREGQPAAPADDAALPSAEDAIAEVVNAPEQTWTSLFPSDQSLPAEASEPEVVQPERSLAQETLTGFFRRMLRRPAPEAELSVPAVPENLTADATVQLMEAPIVSAPDANPLPRVRPLRLRKRPIAPSSADTSSILPVAEPAEVPVSEPVVAAEPAATETPTPTRGSFLSRLLRRSPAGSAADQSVPVSEASVPDTAPVAPAKRPRVSVQDLFKAFTFRWSGRGAPQQTRIVHVAAPAEETVRAPGTGRMLGPHDRNQAPAPRGAAEAAATATASSANAAAKEQAATGGRIVSALDKAEQKITAQDAVAEASEHQEKVNAPHIKLNKEQDKQEAVVVVVDSPKVDKRVKRSMARLKSKTGGFQDFLGAIKYLGLGKERTGIIQNLATMMNAGLPLIDAIHTLQKESPHKPIRKMLQSVVDMVESGSALWRAMESQHFFSPHAISLIRIGEEAGNLAENLERLAIQQEKDASLRGKIKMAMIYPTIVLILMFVIVMGLGIFVLPQLIGVLKSLGGKLPLVTQIVMMFSDFMSQHAALVIFGTLGTVLTLIILAKFTRMKVVFQWISFRIPGIGALAKEATIARFGVILGSLLEAGVPLIEALNSLAEVTTIIAYRKFYVRLAEHVNLGDSFSKSFQAIRGSQKLLPITVQQLIMTGERSGSLAKVLMKISDIYEKKANETAEKLPVILEPMILLMIGALVGTIAFAIIIPIYSVVGNVGKA